MQIKGQSAALREFRDRLRKTPPTKKKCGPQLHFQKSGNGSIGREKQPRVDTNFHEYLPDYYRTIVIFIRVNSWLISPGFTTTRKSITSQISP
jgi:hypothetical protein